MEKPTSFEHKLDDRRSRLPNLRRCDFQHLLGNFSMRFLSHEAHEVVEMFFFHIPGSTCSRSVGYVRSTTGCSSNSSSIAERCGFAGTDNIDIDTIHQLATGHRLMIIFTHDMVVCWQSVNFMILPLYFFLVLFCPFTRGHL